MPNFNRSTAKLGNEVVERGSGGGSRSFKPWLPKIYWKGADDERFVLILNELQDIVRIQYHPYVETDEGAFSTMARTDPGIGERADPIQETWGYVPRMFDVMIAVELEPIAETKVVNGRDRISIVGFEVATRTFERRVRDEDGELTDEKEEIIVPAIGCITQSPFNFGNQLNAYDHNDNPIHLTPFKITQVGAGSGVQYSFQGYPDTEFDLSNLFEYIENISYLDTDEKREALNELLAEAPEGEEHMALGRFILDLKLEELADREAYDEIFKKITKPSKFKDQKQSVVKPGAKNVTHNTRVKAKPEPVEAEATVVEKPKNTKTVGNKTPTAHEKLEQIRASRAAKLASKEAVAA